ncbi:MAG TPA: sugar-binding domain-containing protein, partial [Polyangiaceae bacterium]
MQNQSFGQVAACLVVLSPFVLACSGSSTPSSPTTGEGGNAAPSSGGAASIGGSTGSRATIAAGGSANAGGAGATTSGQSTAAGGVTAGGNVGSGTTSVASGGKTGTATGGTAAGGKATSGTSSVGSGGRVDSAAGGATSAAGGKAGTATGGASSSAGNASTGGTAGAPSVSNTLVNNYDGARPNTVSFDAAWKFHLGDATGAQGATFDDSGWTSLDVPHDWSISLAFNQSSPATFEGGYLDGGVGWYRKTFNLPADNSAQKTIVQFDGVYMDSTVYLNGT